VAFEYRGGAIWGLDPATKTGLAEGVPGSDPVLSVENFRAEKNLPAEEVFYLASFWWATKLRRPPEVLVIEAPIPPAQLVDSDGRAFTNFDVTRVAFGLYGIFCGMARCKDVHVVPANIGAWRRVFLGKRPGGGKWGGTEAKMQAKKNCALLGWPAPDDNAAEAAGIYCYGVGLFVPHKMPPLHKCDPLLARKLFG
jgi:hypothetical protein